MKTEDIIRLLGFDPSLKEALLRIFDTHPPEKRVAISRILWITYDAIIEVRNLENLYSKRIEEILPPGTTIDNVFSLLREVSSERHPNLPQEIMRETEEEFERWPDAFSRYIVVVANNKLKNMVWG